MMSLPIPEPPYCTKLNKYGGFTSNMRGTLFYSPHMDKFDNPGMVSVLSNVYSLTTTKKDFIPKGLLTGKECLPNGLEVSESGFTHEPAHGVSTSDQHSIERASREGVNSSYMSKKQLTPCCGLPSDLATETREAYSTDLLNLGKPAPAVKSIVGEMESGFTRNTQPNPTDGRVLDPVHLGQYPAMGRFGPSVTHMDFVYNPHLTGKERNQHPSRQTDLTSGYWQERSPPPCYLKGTLKNICKPREDYETSYRVHFPKRWCNSDFSGFQLSGKPAIPPNVLADVNLFEGKGYYVSETMERFSAIPKNRVQQFPTCMKVNYTPSIFPRGSLCPQRPDCPDMASTWTCTSKSSPICSSSNCA